LRSVALLSFFFSVCVHLLQNEKNGIRKDAVFCAVKTAYAFLDQFSLFFAITITQAIAERAVARATTQIISRVSGLSSG
jgi:hypothetical protein